MEKNSVPDSSIRTCNSSVCTAHCLIFFFFAWPFHTLFGVGPTYHVPPGCSVLVVSLLTWVSSRFLFTRDIHVIRDLPRSRGSVSISDYKYIRIAHEVKYIKTQSHDKVLTLVLQILLTFIHLSNEPFLILDQYIIKKSLDSID